MCRYNLGEAFMLASCHDLPGAFAACASLHGLPNMVITRIWRPPLYGSRIFLKPGILPELERLRLELIGEHAAKVQAIIRGVVGRSPHEEGRRVPS